MTGVWDLLVGDCPAQVTEVTLDIQGECWNFWYASRIVTFTGQEGTVGGKIHPPDVRQDRIQAIPNF